MRYISMKILTTSTEPQTLKIIPREYVTDATMVVRDDTNNTSVNYSVTPTTYRNYLSIDQAFDLKEGRYYDLTIKNTGNSVIFKDKIFCTSQSVDQTANDSYTVNDSVFTIDTTYDNDFIVL
mgnify:FL=1